MATRISASASSDSAWKKADAFLNVRVTGKDGKVYAFKTGVPLHSENKLDRAVMANPDSIQAALAEGRVQLSVFVMGQETDTEVDI